MASVARSLAHVLPALLLVLVTYWMGAALTAYSKDAGGAVVAKRTAGFSWAKGDGRVFNWHPVLMTLGLLFCSTQAALAYLSLPFSHDINKRIHAALHGLGFASSVLGLVAVFRFHNEHGITNLYSLHSWLGLTVVIAFSAVYLVSFLVFLYPGAQQAVRAFFLPYHIAIGLSILSLAFATAATGVLEKLSFNGSCNVSGVLNGNPVSGYMAADCVLGNSIGLVLAAALTAVLVAIWEAKYKAQSESEPAPLSKERVPLLSGEAASRV